MKPEAYMRLALELAKKGSPSPNPRVGCVLVKGGEIIGRGYHKKAGMLHAEVEAILDAKLTIPTTRQETHGAKHGTKDIENQKQGTGAQDTRCGTRDTRRETQDTVLYLTLEPCSHEWVGKRTPACADVIIEAGIGHVVIAMKDPNPKVSGTGIEKLRHAGIDVELGILEREARELNAPYIKFMERGVPYVAMKMAMSLDGKSTTNTGESKWLSCEESRVLVQNTRSEFDAVMVGAGTIKKDDPELTCRIAGAHSPIKIIVDSELCIDAGARFMKEPGKVIIATTNNAPKNKIKKFSSLGARVIVCGKKAACGNGVWPLREPMLLTGQTSSGGGFVDLNVLVQELAKLGVQSILLEGGSELNASALEAGIVDRLCFFIAPKIIGGRGAGGPVGGVGIEDIGKALKVKNMKARQVGGDLLVEAEL